MKLFLDFLFIFCFSLLLLMSCLIVHLLTGWHCSCLWTEKNRSDHNNNHEICQLPPQPPPQSPPPSPPPNSGTTSSASSPLHKDLINFLTSFWWSSCSLSLSHFLSFSLSLSSFSTYLSLSLFFDRPASHSSPSLSLRGFLCSFHWLWTIMLLEIINSNPHQKAWVALGPLIMAGMKGSLKKEAEAAALCPTFPSIRREVLQWNDAVHVPTPAVGNIWLVLVQQTGWHYSLLRNVPLIHVISYC